MGKVLSLSLTVRGFIQDEFVPTHQDAFLRDMAAWLGDGSVRYREDIVDGLETFPETLLKLFKGENTGKLVLKVADA